MEGSAPPTPGVVAWDRLRMLDREQPPSGGSDRVAAPKLGVSPSASSPQDAGSLNLPGTGSRGILGQPRLAVGLALILGGFSWAIARGLHFYGMAPAHLAYDLDQPPVLVVLVGAWLLARGRRP